MYLAATILDKQDADAAYGALIEMNLKPAQIQCLGFDSSALQPDSYYDPNQDTQRQVKRMMSWLLPFGFFAGFTFNRITGLTMLTALNPLMNSFLGGLLGAGSGVLGGIFIGGGTKVFYRNPDEWTYERRVAFGKYVLLVTGTDVQIRQVSRQLRSHPYDSIEIYEGPARPNR